jgi:hypothetical protein
LIVVILGLGLGHFVSIAWLTVSIGVIFIVSVRVFGGISVDEGFGLVVAVIVVIVIIVNVFVTSFVGAGLSVRVFIADFVIVKLIGLEFVQRVLIVVYK